MMPLTVADRAQTYCIQRLGGKPEVRKHLENLGFVVGSEVCVISAIGGNLIVKVKDTRVAISQEMGNGRKNPGVSREHLWMIRRQKSMKTLRQLAVGETGTVVRLHGEGAVKRRIMDMGITKGVAVRVRKVAPLGDPVEITVRGYELSLRKADADMIEVE